MDKKYYIIGGILALLLIFLGAWYFMGTPTKTNEEDIELVWWKTFEDTENVQDLITDYTTLHPNVNITYVKKDSTEYEQDLVNAIASGQGPDIFSIHNDWLPKHGDKIAPVPDSILNVRNYKDAFVDVAYGDFVKDNKIYGIPLSVDVLALYYNKDILGTAGISQPPTTWPELVSDVQKITKVSKTGIFTKSGVALGTSANVNRAVDILTLLMLQNGTQFYSEDFSSAKFDQSVSVPGATQDFNPGATALSFYTQFANPAKTSYSWNVKLDFSIDAFTQGKLGMMLSYQYMEPLIRARAPNLSWEVAAVPQVADDASKINFANYWAESVSKNSKNQEAAWDFLNFISGKDELNKYYSKHKLVSSRKDILPSQISDTDIGVFAENALTARSVYKKDANIYESVFLKTIDDVILNNKESADTLHNAAAQINLTLLNQ